MATRKTTKSQEMTDQPGATERPARTPELQQRSRASIDAILQRLNEHWVHDVAELLIDCSVGVHRIEKLLLGLKRNPAQLRDRAKLMCALERFAEFEQDWEKENLRDPQCKLACPDEVEWHLRQIRKAGASPGRRASMKKADEREDYFRSFETVQQIRNPR